MAVSHNYRAYVVDKLAGVGPVKTRRMFSGVGIYRDETIFAIIANNAVYFKTDSAGRGDFEALGMEPFQADAEDTREQCYYRLPDTVLEDPKTLAAWVNRACQVGRVDAAAETAAKVSLAG